jgi:hypothetical protein
MLQSLVCCARVCVCVCARMHMHTHTCTGTHVHRHTHIGVRIHTIHTIHTIHLYMKLHVCIHKLLQVCIHIHTNDISVPLRPFHRQ